MKIYTILIVDDNSQNLDILNKILRARDYTVRISKSGSHALKSIKALPPDLVLLDINMPLMSGYEVCEQIKRDELTGHIPVIFLTADLTAEVKAAGREVGGEGFLCKPFKEEELYSVVESALISR